MHDVRFTALAERLRVLEPNDLDSVQRARVEIAELKFFLERLVQRELADLLGAADSMLRSIGVLEGGAFGQVRELLTTLVGVVAEAVAGLGSSPRDQPPAAALPRDVEVALATADEPRRRPQKLSLEGETTSSFHTGLHTMSELLLGQILIDAGKLSRPDLVEALKLQTRERIRIGEALMRLGHLTEADLGEALRLQAELVAGHTAGAGLEGSSLLQDLTMGAILTRIGGVSQADIERGLCVQRATGKRLGEALVELGLTTWARIEEAARIQERSRSRTEWDSVGTGGGKSLRLDD